MLTYALDVTEGSGEAVPRGRQIQVARLAGNFA